jgi:hypothetical protein
LYDQQSPFAKRYRNDLFRLRRFHQENSTDYLATLPPTLPEPPMTSTLDGLGDV